MAVRVVDGGDQKPTRRAPLVAPLKPARVRPLKSLRSVMTRVASSVRVDARNRKQVRDSRQAWQVRALDYYDVLGEIWYAGQFYARSLQKLELYVAWENPETGDLEKVEGRPEVTELLDSLRDESGGREQLLATFGRLWFLVGEAFLMGTFQQDGSLVWEVLSNQELEVLDGGKYKRRSAPSDQGLELTEPAEGEAGTPGQVMVWRIWRPHPRWSGIADSPMRAVLEQCEEMILAAHAQRAYQRSRLAGAGLLLIPDEASPVDDEETDTAQTEDPEADKFMADLTDSLVRPIEDEGDASAVVPHVTRMAADYIEKVRFISFRQEGPVDVRPDCIRRLAIGLDMPPAALTGSEDANHWSAWNITRDAWVAHAEPVAIALVSELTRSLLRPSLEATNVADADRYFVWYDPGKVVMHPDRGKDALEVYDRGQLGEMALRVAKGFDDKDKPTDEEYKRWLGAKLGDAQLALEGTPSDDGSDPNAEPGDPPAQPEGEDPSAAPDDGPPPGEQAQTASVSRETLQGVYEVLIEAQAERLLERAGSRIRNTRKAGRAIEGIASRSICASLGEPRLRELGFDPDDLVRGDGDCLIATARRFDIPHTRALALVATAEERARARMFDEPA